MELRKLCLNCTLKHLSQAFVLLTETVKGYPEHKWIALGHLAEAEDECIASYPETAARIREIRLSLQNDEISDYNIEGLIREVSKIKEEDGSGCGVC